jgi:hypothetical protein
MRALPRVRLVFFFIDDPKIDWCSEDRLPGHSGHHIYSRISQGEVTMNHLPQVTKHLVKTTAYVFFCTERSEKAGYRYKEMHEVEGYAI